MIIFPTQIVQGKESTPLEDEEPQIRIVLNNKLKKLVPDKEAEEVAAIYDGILQEHNETLARESLVSFKVQISAKTTIDILVRFAGSLRRVRCTEQSQR